MSETPATVTGWLLDQSYGATDPPGVLVQRDDEADIYPGDLDAALAYAKSIGGTAHAIMTGGLMAYLSDAWVMPGGPGGLVTHTIQEAVDHGWYLDEENA